MLTNVFSSAEGIEDGAVKLNTSAQMCTQEDLVGLELMTFGSAVDALPLDQLSTII